MKQLYLEGFAIVMFLISVGLAVGVLQHIMLTSRAVAPAFGGTPQASTPIVCFLLKSITVTKSYNFRVAISGDLLEAFPKGILNADARLVSGDDDGVFDDQR